MQQELKPFQDSTLKQNPESQIEIHEDKQTKKKKKKVNLKKYIKPPVKHQFFTTNNPLYQALNDQDILDSNNANQLNFGPWVKSELNLNEEFFPTIDNSDKKSLISNLKNLQKQENIDAFESMEMSKSTEFLPKFDSLTKPMKLQKNSSRNSTYFRVPVWNAFIQEQTVSMPSNSYQTVSQKDLVKKRQTTLNFDTGKKKADLHLVSIGQNDSLRQTKKIKFNLGNRETNRFSSTRGQKFHEYSTRRMDLLEKIRANAVVYNYCLDTEGRTTPTLSNFKESEDKSTQKKTVINNLKKRKNEIYQQKLSGMELKLVVPEQKSKLIFLPRPQKPAKSTVSKYIFMDLLENRNKAK